MSYQTTADDKMKATKDAVGEAVTCLAEVVVKRCSGWDSWTESYQEKQSRWLAELLRLRNEMGT